MVFSTKQYGWKDIAVVMGGKVITGITELEYNQKQDKKYLYGRGENPHEIQRGNNEFDGKIPMTVDELVQLPGVGRKTANVVTSVVDRQPNMAVDTHVFRVAHRLNLTNPGVSAPSAWKHRDPLGRRAGDLSQVGCEWGGVQPAKDPAPACESRIRFRAYDFPRRVFCAFHQSALAARGYLVESSADAPRVQILIHCLIRF